MSSSTSKKKRVSKKHEKREAPPSSVDEICEEFGKILEARAKTLLNEIKTNFKNYLQNLSVENCESKLTKTALENDTIKLISQETVAAGNRYAKPLVNTQKTKREKELEERKSKIHKSVTNALSSVIEKNENCLKVVPKDEKEGCAPLILSGDAITHISSFLPFKKLLSLRLVCKVFAEKSSKSMLDAFVNEVNTITIDYEKPLNIENVKNLGALGLSLVFNQKLPEAHVTTTKSALADWLAAKERFRNLQKGEQKPFPQRTNATVDLVVACAEAMNMLPEYEFDFVLSNMSMFWFATPKESEPISKQDEDDLKIVKKQLSNDKSNFSRMIAYIKNYSVLRYNPLSLNIEINSWVNEGGKSIEICNRFRIFNVLDKFEIIKFNCLYDHLAAELFKHLENKSEDSKTNTIVIEDKLQAKAISEGYPKILSQYKVIDKYSKLVCDPNLM